MRGSATSKNQTALQPYRCPERIQLLIGNRHHVLRLGIGAGLDVGDEFAVGGDAFALQAFVFGGEVAVGLGVAGAVARGVTEHVNFDPCRGEKCPISPAICIFRDGRLPMSAAAITNSIFYVSVFIFS